LIREGDLGVDDEEHVTTLKLPPNVVHAGRKSLQSMMKAARFSRFTGPAGVRPLVRRSAAGIRPARLLPILSGMIRDVEKVEADCFAAAALPDP